MYTNKTTSLEVHGVNLGWVQLPEEPHLETFNLGYTNLLGRVNFVHSKF